MFKLAKGKCWLKYQFVKLEKESKKEPLGTLSEYPPKLFAHRYATCFAAFAPPCCFATCEEARQKGMLFHFLLLI